MQLFNILKQYSIVSACIINAADTLIHFRVGVLLLSTVDMTIHDCKECVLKLLAYGTFLSQLIMTGIQLFSLFLLAAPTLDGYVNFAHLIMKPT